MKENALIRQCQKGDRRAFEELISLFYPYVSGFLLKTTKDPSLAEDLTQDTFLKMIHSIDKYHVQGKASFGTWLITIARNCYIDYWRRNRTYPDTTDHYQVESPQNICEDLITKLQYEEAIKAIEKLPPEQGMAIRLKYEESLTLNEIAERFGVPAKTIKSRIHDGTVKLRKLLKHSERKKNL